MRPGCCLILTDPVTGGRLLFRVPVWGQGLDLPICHQGLSSDDSVLAPPPGLTAGSWPTSEPFLALRGLSTASLAQGISPQSAKQANPVPRATLSGRTEQPGDGMQALEWESNPVSVTATCRDWGNQFSSARAGSRVVREPGDPGGWRRAHPGSAMGSGRTLVPSSRSWPSGASSCLGTSGWLAWSHRECTQPTNQHPVNWGCRGTGSACWVPPPPTVLRTTGLKPQVILPLSLGEGWGLPLVLYLRFKGEKSISSYQVFKL